MNKNFKIKNYAIIRSKILSFSKKRLLFVMLFIFCFTASFSQVKLTGKIHDYNNNPIEFAEVLLLGQDSTTAKIEFTDQQGVFLVNIKQGNYIFQIKQLNKTLYTQKIEVYNNSDLGIIKIELETNLEEVIIQGKKNLIDRKVDRIVYNISNDVFNKGSSLMDALDRAPRLNVEQDNISIVGKGGNVQVMIDGRLINLSDDALKAKLKGLSADQVAKVEIIPIPPSRYSATGNGGMINIILKRDENLGLQGSANADISNQYGRIGTGQGINLKYKSKKLDFTLNANYNRLKGSNLSKLTYDFVQTTTIIENLSDFEYKMPNVNTIFQYQINSKINIGATLDYGENKLNANTPGSTQFYNKLLQKNDSLMYSKNLSNANNHNKAVSVYTDYSIDSLGKKLSFTYNYSHNKNASDSYNTAEIDANNLIKNRFFSNFGNNRYQINGLFLDFELPFKFGKLETGGALTHINNNTGITYFDDNNHIDYLQSNQFEYTEKTTAAYLSFQKEWSKKWSSKLGLRLENTHIQGYSPTLQITNTYNYSKLFPTLFISYNPNDKQAFSIAYSKRLDRPTFDDLNPFRYYTNAYNYLAGNPYLLPTYTHSIELSYTLNNNLNFTSYGNYITDGIAYITEVDYTNTYATKPFNNFTQQKLGLMESYTIKPFTWNNISTSFNGYYTQLKSEKAIKRIQGWGGELNLRSTYELNQSKTTLLELMYRQTLPSKAYWSDNYTRAFAVFNVSFKQLFLNKNLVLELWLSDLFTQNFTKSEKQYDTFYYSQYFDARNRGVYLSINYTFGNKKVEGLYRESKNVDKNRAIK